MKRSHSMQGMYIVVGLVIFCVLFMQVTVFGAKSFTEGAENLLVNPDWENGTDGWEIETELEDLFPDGRAARRSDIYQELSLEGYEEGQVITFSGLIGTAVEDPTQELIRMGLSVYGADGNLIETADDSENSTELILHEVSVVIPAGAARVRAALSIFKQSTMNVAYFEDLRLEIGQASGEKNEGAFVKAGANVSDKPEELITSEADSKPENVSAAKSDSMQEDITGIWYLQEQFSDDPDRNASLQSGTPMSLCIILNEDGSLVYEEYDVGEVGFHMEGTWTYDGYSGSIDLNLGTPPTPFVIEGGKLILQEEVKSVFGREKPDREAEASVSEPEMEAANAPETEGRVGINMGSISVTRPGSAKDQDDATGQETTAPLAYLSEYAGQYAYYCRLLTPEFMEHDMEMYGIEARDAGNRYVWLDDNKGMTIDLYEDGTGLVTAADGSQSHITWEMSEDGAFSLIEAGVAYPGSIVDGFLTLDLFEDSSFCFAASGAELPEEVLEYDEYFYLLYDMENLAGRLAEEEGGLSREEVGQLVETGKGYFYGTGQDGFDLDKAREYFMEAAAAVSGEAWYYLGTTCLYSADTDRYENAMTCFEDAVLAGCELGFIGQGNLYLNGYGVEMDQAKALELYQEALDQGCIEANLAIGNMYKNGFVVETDGLKAMEYYTKVLDSSDFGFRNEAKCCIGSMYYYGAAGIDNDMGQAMLWFAKAAEENYGHAFYYVGLMYESGNGESGTYDYETALTWYQRGAAHGSPDALSNIGTLFSRGVLGTRDVETAFQYWLQAANLGNAGAMYSVGMEYEYGNIVQMDYATARWWYENALAGVSADTTPLFKDQIQESIARVDAYGTDYSQGQDTGYDTSADYGYDYDYNYDYYEYETQPWEDPYFIGYTQDGTPQYSYDTYQYETQPWEDPYFIGYTQDGTPQYSNR